MGHILFEHGINGIDGINGINGIDGINASHCVSWRQEPVSGYQ